MDLPMFAFKCNLIAGPKLLHQGDGLLHPADPVLPVGAEGRKFLFPVSQSNPQGEPAIAYVVQGHHLVSDVHGVVIGEQQDPGDEP